MMATDVAETCSCGVLCNVHCVGGLFAGFLTESTMGMKNRKTIRLIITLQIQHGTVPIPKSSNKKRLQENIDIFNFELSEQDVAAIDGLDRNARICTL
jgi:2,5-diketo-D-gluconate reductase A